MPRKTSKKTTPRTSKGKKAGEKAGPLVPQPHGGRIYQGAPANPVAGTGRPPDAFKELCRQLASGDITVDGVKAILTNPDHPQFMAALKWATEHGYGKPVASVEVTGKDGGPVDVRQQIVLGGRTIVF